MTKQRPAAQPATALSPYLSLRQAVRPAVFAHTQLAREQGKGGALAEECGDLLRSTRELLKAAALVHLLTPETDHGIRVDVGRDRREQMLDAYANAGMLWANIVGNFIALADLLLEQGRSEDVENLSVFLESAGEVEVANNLRKRAVAGYRKQIHNEIAGFHANMTMHEIHVAIQVLRTLPVDFPGRKLEISLGLVPIANSLCRRFRPEGFTTYGYIAENGCAEHMAEENLSKVTAEFGTRYGKGA